jgi:hypothetical protein
MAHIAHNYLAAFDSLAGGDGLLRLSHLNSSQSPILSFAHTLAPYGALHSFNLSSFPISTLLVWHRQTQHIAELYNALLYVTPSALGP